MNMEHDERFWESVARHVEQRGKGPPSAEQRLAEEILADEAFLAPRLDVPMPGGMVFRAAAHLDEAIQRSRHSGRRWAWKPVVGAATAAAVAAVLLIVTLSGPPDDAVSEKVWLSPNEAADAYLAQTPAAGELDADVEAMTALVQYMADEAGRFHPASHQPVGWESEDMHDEIFIDPHLFGLDSIPEL